MSTTNAIAKSTTPARTDAAGITSRGKYTFLTRLQDVTRLSEDWLRPCAKKVQGRSPAYEKMGYGSPSDPMLASLPKKIVNTIIARRGCRTAQAAPSAVCLYRTLTSRHTRKYSSSRYSQTS